MALVHFDAGMPASASGPPLRPENAVVVSYQPSGAASATLLIFLTDGDVGQVKLKRCIDALAVQALPEQYEQDRAARTIQSNVRNKNLRAAVKTPNRALE